jgi:hypothetical protein
MDWCVGETQGQIKMLLSFGPFDIKFFFTINSWRLKANWFILFNYFSCELVTPKTTTHKLWFCTSAKITWKFAFTFLHRLKTTLETNCTWKTFSFEKCLLIIASYGNSMHYGPYLEM